MMLYPRPMSSSMPPSKRSRCASMLSSSGPCELGFSVILPGLPRFSALETSVGALHDAAADGISRAALMVLGGGFGHDGAADRVAWVSAMTWPCRFLHDTAADGISRVAAVAVLRRVVVLHLDD